MAQAEYGPNHPLAVRLWAKRLFVEALRETFVDRFIGDAGDTNALVQMRDELKKSAGDRVTIGLRVQLTGPGVQGDLTLEGNEEALALYNDLLIIDQLRHAVRSAGKMSEQRVPFSVRQESMDGLKDWWSDRIDTWFFNQICGNTAQTDVRYTGLQPTIAPDAVHFYRPNARVADEALTVGDEFGLSFIDKMVARAKTFNFAGANGGGSAAPLRPIKVQGGSYYVIFIHPFQTYQLRSNTNAGAWADLQRARITGGVTDEKNMLFSGGSYIGVYNGCVIHESARVANGVNSVTAASVSNARRAVLCGAQAALFATGREQGTPEKMNWVEELFDYNNQLGVAAGLIAGLKKTLFNSLDYGVITMGSYSPQPV